MAIAKSEMIREVYITPADRRKRRKEAEEAERAEVGGEFQVLVFFLLSLLFLLANTLLVWHYGGVGRR